MNSDTAGNPIYEIPICSCGQQNTAGLCSHINPYAYLFPDLRTQQPQHAAGTRSND